MNFIQKTIAYISRLPRLYSIGGAVIIIVVAAVGVHVATRGSAAPSQPAVLSHVQIASVASLSSATGPLPVIGNVTSLSQASILAESSGEIVSLAHQLGDHVAAGEVIAEFENSSQQAAVLQAQGAYDAAQAALANASGSTAANSGITASQAAAAAANAQASAQATLQSAYAALDDAVHTKADTLFSNPRTVSPTLNLNIPDSQLTITTQNERSQLEPVLADADKLANDPSSADIDSNIDAMNADAQIVETFLNNLIAAVNQAQPNQNTTAAVIAGYQSSVGAARTEVVGAVTSLTAAKSSYDAAQSAATSASNSAGSGTNNNIAAAQANVKEALGALDAAQANLEKTIIRSPISGTIVSLSLTQGGFVSSFAQVALISNPGALEVDTYVTPDDAKTLAVGGTASIEGGVNGVIVSIAPALDPTTNKIEVKIGIPGDQSALTDGDTVSLTLARSTASSTSSTASSSAILIPIVAAKITPQGPVVFTVASSTLVSNPITLGDIVGDQVTVTAGLTPEMDIVTDARGLSDGQQVVVDSTQ